MRYFLFLLVSPLTQILTVAAGRMLTRRSVGLPFSLFASTARKLLLCIMQQVSEGCQAYMEWLIDTVLLFSNERSSGMYDHSKMVTDVNILPVKCELKMFEGQKTGDSYQGPLHF